MIFYYPSNAITAKDLDRFSYRTYDAIGINLNKYNNDSSNTFRLIDTAGSELSRILFDMNYQFNPSMSDIDFVTIDRINRFYISSINTIVYDKLSNTVKSDRLYGYSKYTNTTYQLENVNKFTDFTRHSLPCDIFLETGYSATGNYSLTPISITLTQNVKSNLDIKVKNSKITIEITEADIVDILLLTPPILYIEGYDKEYKPVKESIEVYDKSDIFSKYEYSEIKSILLIGTSDTLEILLLPYVKNKTAQLDYKYIDREEQYEFETLLSVNMESKKLVLSKKDMAIVYPYNLDPLEEVSLDIPTNEGILDYIFDQANGLLYTLCSDVSLNKKVYIFPLIIPQSRKNLDKLKRTKEQSVKVSYTKDTLSEKYSFIFHPAMKVHGVEALDISLIYFAKDEKGEWKPETQYAEGDLIVFNGFEYIAKTDHTSPALIDMQLDYFELNFTQKTVYLVQGMLLDLITNDMESNTVDIPFDRLFEFGDEAIIQIDTNGYRNCSCQILVQNKKLEPLVSRDLQQLHNNIISTPATGAISPINNQENLLLSNRINNYNLLSDNSYDHNDEHILYRLSSNNKIFVNGKSMTYVFNTFFLDWGTSTLITSDTITHIFTEV